MKDAAAAVVVILAAGAASRFGSPKQLAPLQGEPMLRRISRLALATGHPVLVVGGAHAEVVGPTLADLPLAWCPHAGWAQGLGSSIAFATGQLRDRWPQTSAALLLLGDQPLVDTALLRRLLVEHRQYPAAIVACDYGPQLGPPVLFPRASFAALGRLQGDRGAQALLADPTQPLRRIEAPRAAFDVDRPEQQQLAEQYLSGAPD